MYYTKFHEWISVQGSIGTVGITKRAQKELGEIVFVEMPVTGAAIRQGDEVVVLESTKAAVDIYAPVSGTVVAVNEAAKKDPSLVNRFPESEGWLFQMELSHPEELTHLSKGFSNAAKTDS